MQSVVLRRGVPATALAVMAVGPLVASRADAPVKPVAMNLEQARQTVAMLNDLYVTTVVLTHGTYVKDRGTVAAATVARQVFGAMEKKGWPKIAGSAPPARAVQSRREPKGRVRARGGCRAEERRGPLRAGGEQALPGGDAGAAGESGLSDVSHPRQGRNPMGGLYYTVRLKP